MKRAILFALIFLCACTPRQKITELQTLTVPVEMDRFAVGDHEIVLSFDPNEKNRLVFHMVVDFLKSTPAPVTASITSIAVPLNDDDVLDANEIEQIRQARVDLAQGKGGSTTMSVDAERAAELFADEENPDLNMSAVLVRNPENSVAVYQLSLTSDIGGGTTATSTKQGYYIMYNGQLYRLPDSLFAQ